MAMRNSFEQEGAPQWMMVRTDVVRVGGGEKRGMCGVGGGAEEGWREGGEHVEGEEPGGKWGGWWA